MWMGLVWIDGMVIIGHRSSKYTFCAYNYHYHLQCGSGITSHYHHAYHQGKRRKFSKMSSLFSQDLFLKCLHYFPRQRKKKFMEEIDFLSLLEHFQEVVARHQLARYEHKQNLPKKSKNLRQDFS